MSYLLPIRHIHSVGVKGYTLQDPSLSGFSEIASTYQPPVIATYYLQVLGGIGMACVQERYHQLIWSCNCYLFPNGFLKLVLHSFWKMLWYHNMKFVKTWCRQNIFAILGEILCTLSHYILTLIFCHSLSQMTQLEMSVTGFLARLCVIWII